MGPCTCPPRAHTHIQTPTQTHATVVPTHLPHPPPTPSHRVSPPPPPAQALSLRALVVTTTTKANAAQPRDDVYGPYDGSYLQTRGPKTATQSPIVTGTSVIAIKFKDGVVMAADNLG